MTTNMAIALLAALVLALGCALRWDALKLWWAGLFDGRGPQAPLEIGRVPPPPRHLEAHEHPAAPRRPGYHRSGRRSSQ